MLKLVLLLIFVPWIIFVIGFVLRSIIPLFNLFVVCFYELGMLLFSLLILTPWYWLWLKVTSVENKCVEKKIALYAGIEVHEFIKKRRTL